MSSSDEQTTFGRVKWFNNKTGYGFITALDGEHSGLDVFAHHSGIQVGSEQYRYLVQGEYVSFKLLVDESKKDHKFHAEDITGVLGGMLMCETRNEMPRPTRRRVRKRGSGPRDYDDATQ